MQFICPSCFIKTGDTTVQPGADVPDVMVCAVALSSQFTLPGGRASAPLRCQGCGRTLEIGRPQLAWYGT